jgi:HlyD family secretion protein
VLTDSVPTQKFTRRQVQTGISDGVNIEIKSGLKANEPIRGLKKEM